MCRTLPALQKLVVRAESGDIRAYPNACLHRGRQLKEGLPLVWVTVWIQTAPFMPFVWNLAGASQGAPCEWDFQHHQQGRVWPPG